MKTQVINPESYRAMPWRNGLGTTVELLKQELSEGEGFAWRLSMADVVSDGAFSSFSGYDRTLLLVEGNGLTLDCAGELQRLDRPLQGARFRGEDATFATLHDGPVRDFNVMTLRRQCSARVSGQPHTAAAQLDIDSDLLLIYALGADLRIVSTDTGERLLPAEHLLVVERPASRRVECSGAGFIATQISYANRSQVAR